jgi:hypothetical protein
VTKDIGGFGTDMGGAVIGTLKYHALLLVYRKDFGGVHSSKSLVDSGLRITYPLRRLDFHQYLIFKNLRFTTLHRSFRQFQQRSLHTTAGTGG